MVCPFLASRRHASFTFSTSFAKSGTARLLAAQSSDAKVVSGREEATSLAILRLFVGRRTDSDAH